jgi:hypothetical protein
MVPAALLEGLADAAPEALGTVEVVPGGEGLRFFLLDADLSVPGLLAGVFGSQVWMRGLGCGGGRPVAITGERGSVLAGG